MAIPWRPETAWQCLPARASRVRRCPLGRSKRSQFSFVRAGGSVRGLGDAAPERLPPKWRFAVKFRLNRLPIAFAWESAGSLRGSLVSDGQPRLMQVIREHQGA